VKTAIPTDNGQIAKDFDTATEFSLIEGSGQDLRIDTFEIPSGTAIVDVLGSKGIERLLAAEMSETAIDSCGSHGIQVFYGASGSVADALNLIRMGVLEDMGSGGCSGCSNGSCSPSDEGSGSSCSSCGGH